MGYLKVKNNKGFPQYQFIDNPDFGKDKHARFKYIDQEDRRIREGYEGLDPLHYFYLSKVTLHDKTDGTTYPPDYRLIDKKIFTEYLWCTNHLLQRKGFPADGDGHPEMINGKFVPDPFDYTIIKPRRLALTSIFAAGVSMWNAIVHEGCGQGFTSCDRDRLDDMVNDKFFYSIESCLNNGLIADNGRRKNSAFLHFPFMHEGSPTNISEIKLLDTANSDSAAASPEGAGFKLFFLDEWFLHPRASKVLLSAKDCMINRHKNKVGVIVQGGSCNALNKDGAVRLRDFLQDIKDPETAASLKMRYTFIPGWVGQVVDENGFDDAEAGKAKIYERRDKLRQAALNGNVKSWEKLQNEIKSYAMDEQELITNVESDYFSPNVIHNLNKGRIYVIANEPLKCNLRKEKDRNVYPTKDSIGENDLTYPENERYPYIIVTPPVWGHIYTSGLDPIDFLGANPKGSFFSCTMKDETVNKYVASLEFRTQDPELGFWLWYNFMFYYRSANMCEGKGALCLPEKNKLSSLIAKCQTYDEKYGTLKLLARDPNKRTWESDLDRGCHKTEANFPQILTYGKQYLENNIVPFQRFNDTFPNYNEKADMTNKKADICDAYLNNEFLSRTLFLGEIDEEYKPKVVQEFIRNPHTGRTEIIRKLI